MAVAHSEDECPLAIQAESFALCSSPSARGAQAVSSRSDTGGEVKDSLSGRLLHDPFEGRDVCLFWHFSSQPTGQLNDIDSGSNRYVTQMGFA